MKRKLIVMAMTALLTLIPLMDTEQSFDAYAETTKITETEANASVSGLKTSETKPDKAVVTVSKASLKKFRDGTKKSLKFNTELGSVTLDKTLAKSLISKAKGKKIDIVMENVELSKEQKQLFGDDAVGIKISFRSGGKAILSPKSSGAKAALLLYLSDGMTKPETVCRQISGGKVYRNSFTFTEEEKDNETCLRCDVTGNLNGTFIFGTKENLDKAWLISGVRNTTIKAKVVTAQKAKDGKLSYVDLSWERSKGFKLDGYEIFHSYNKISYQKAYTLEGNGCYNRNVEAGTTKYYKIRGYRIINGMPYYTRWSNVISGSV